MKYLYSNRYWDINKEYNLDKLLYLMVDRPDQILFDEDFIWSINDYQRHRDYDLPASCIYNIDNRIYSLFWYKNLKFHRGNNKPALIRYDGYKEYYKYSKFIKEEKPK